MKFLKFFYAELLSWIEAIFGSLPGMVGVLIRRNWYKMRFEKVDKIYIGDNCKFICPSKMVFNGRVSIGGNTYFNADGGRIIIGDEVVFNIGVILNSACGGLIDIGANCLIGPGVLMRTADHIFLDPNILIRKQGHAPKNIVVEDDCWLGANVIVLGGVKIGKGSVIGAGSIVTKDIPSMSVAVGVPAKVIKTRNN